MDGETSIREATREDLPRVVELLGQLARDPSQEDLDSARQRYEDAFADVTADRRQRLFVLERGGEIVATASLVVVPNLSHRGMPYAIVESVVVEAAHRGKRLGEELMHHLVEQARGAGCYKVALMSRLEREDAHRFYERIGFRFAHKGFRLDL